MNTEEAKQELRELQQLISTLESNSIPIGEKVKGRLYEIENKLITFLKK